VQRCLGLGDLDFGRDKSDLAGAIGQPASKERLTAPVFTANCLENASAGGDLLQLFVERTLEAIKTNGKGIEAALGHRSPAQSIDDLVSSLRADTRQKLLPQAKLMLQEFAIQFHRVRDIIPRQYGKAVNIQDALHHG
jgi:hypothetical protein